MDDGRGTGGAAWKLVAVCFLLLSPAAVRDAEGNYAALYDYDRNALVDSHESYVLDTVRTLTLLQPVNYYGQKYSTLQVSKDGTVGFGPNSQVSFKRHPQWPLGFTELTSAADIPFIAPLHHEGYTSQINPQTYTGRMFTQQYRRSGDSLVTLEDKRHQDFLDYLGSYLSHSSVTVRTFVPTLYVMLTWENVTDHATVDGTSDPPCSATMDAPCPSSTFQLVLAANDLQTFAIFNYAKVDIAYNEAHLAGMNGGLGRGWTDVVRCGRACRKNKHESQIMAALSSMQASSSRDHNLRADRSSDDVRGRFLFVVTDDVIVRGGCLPRDNKIGYIDTVEVYPPQVEMLGGQIIEVTGPCKDPYTPVYCRFDGQAVTEGKITAGMVGWCPVPRLTSRGRVKLEVSADGADWTFFTHVIVIPPDHISRWSDDVAMAPWFQVNPSQLRLAWDPRQLMKDNDVATVDIVLVQYRESGGQVEWRDIPLSERQPNTGTFSFDPRAENSPRCLRDCDDVKLGLVEIRLSPDHLESATQRQYISIGPLPLGWYVNRHHTDYTGWDWPRDQCFRWAERERQARHWLTEFPPCPCSLQQALADWGRWQADSGCSMFQHNSQCTFNEGAKHCVRSVQPTGSAAGSHCCYDNDYNLMYSGDSYSGSTCSRAHAWGALPYSTPGTVPAMSHWLQDLIPYYQCCVWTANELCQHFTDLRPTKDCRAYDPPGSATIYGDPHVTTFDSEGYSYHFGGAGDFWLVQSAHLNVQARFLEKPSDTVLHRDHFLLPTHISSVVVKGDDNSDTVTFTMAPPGDVHPRRLDVKVDNRHYFFDTDLNVWQDFRGFSVVNNVHYAESHIDQVHSNFTVLLKSGAGVQVAERNGLLNVVVVLPPYQKIEGATNQAPASMGLLGTWDEKRVNEFMKPDGNYVPATSARDDIIYDDFASKWAVTEAQSLFQFHHPTDSRRPHMGSELDYTNPDTRPSDITVSSECASTQQLGSGSGSGSGSRGGNNPCAHDYYVTGNRTLALDTKVAGESFESLRRSQRKVWSCGWLKIPYAIKDHYNYSAGNTLRVTGCRAGPDSAGSVSSGGSDVYTCVQNETDHLPYWEPYDVYYNLCMDEAEGANMFMIIGIVAGAVVVIAIAVIAFLMYRRKQRSKKESVSKPAATAREEAAMDRGTDETLLKRKPAPRNIRMSELNRDRESEPV